MINYRLLSQVRRMYSTVLCLVFYVGLIQGFTENFGKTDGKPAKCLPSSDCPSSNSTNSIVCCNTKPDLHRKIVKRATQYKLTSIKKICGFQHADDYVHTVNGTVVTEFPWLAQIKVHRSEYWEEYECTGSLINQRYVLTAAACLDNSEFSAVGVRLGEFHVWNSTDCIEDAHQVECSEAVEDYGIEKMIPHPYYNEITGDNDIGLIRVNKTIKFSDYIRPVCLPYPEIKFETETTLITSGWGQLTYRKEAAQKARLESILITHEQCRKALSAKNVTVEYSEEKFFCVQPMSEHICTEENHGSPVITQHRRRKRQWQWFQRGMVTIKSYSTTCRYPLPVLYTNVSFYMAWIEENIEAYDPF